jgi:hypothetical protein
MLEAAGYYVEEEARAIAARIPLRLEGVIILICVQNSIIYSECSESAAIVSI